jgi:hypothetical protein
MDRLMSALETIVPLLHYYFKRVLLLRLSRHLRCGYLSISVSMVHAVAAVDLRAVPCTSFRQLPQSESYVFIVLRSLGYLVYATGGRVSHAASKGLDDGLYLPHHLLKEILRVQRDSMMLRVMQPRVAPWNGSEMPPPTYRE